MADVYKVQSITIGGMTIKVDATMPPDVLEFRDANGRVLGRITNLDIEKTVVEKICPRAKSDMTPCIVTDGDVAFSDDGVCVGCGWKPASLVELQRERTQFSVQAPKEHTHG